MWCRGAGDLGHSGTLNRLVKFAHHQSARVHPAFMENVFYRLGGHKIEQIWCVIDKAAIKAEL